MPRTCTICGHDERHQIDVALVRRDAYRHIARRFDVSTRSLQRHAKEHIPGLLVKAREAEEIAEATDLLADITRLRDSAFDLLDRAERSFEWKAQVAAIREARENIRILAELQGRLATQGTTTIINSPEYLEVRALIVQALGPYPDARLAVVRALEGPPMAEANGAH